MGFFKLLISFPLVLGLASTVQGEFTLQKVEDIATGVCNGGYKQTMCLQHSAAKIFLPIVEGGSKWFYEVSADGSGEISQVSTVSGTQNRYARYCDVLDDGSLIYNFWGIDSSTGKYSFTEYYMESSGEAVDGGQMYEIGHHGSTLYMVSRTSSEIYYGEVGQSLSNVINFGFSRNQLANLAITRDGKTLYTIKTGSTPQLLKVDLNGNLTAPVETELLLDLTEAGVASYCQTLDISADGRFLYTNCRPIDSSNYNMGIVAISIDTLETTYFGFDSSVDYLVADKPQGVLFGCVGADLKKITINPPKGHKKKGVRSLLRNNF